MLISKGYYNYILLTFWWTLLSLRIFFFVKLQGLMFGYATDETDECMPLTVVLAHSLNRKLSELRRDGTLWWARPDTKTQVIIQKKIFFLNFPAKI